MDKQSSNRELAIFGPISNESIIGAIGTISEFHRQDSGKEIILYICSPGGSIAPAFAFYDYIRQIIRHDNFTTIALGAVDSMALIVFLAGSKRFSGSRASFYLHELFNGSSKDEHHTATELEVMYRDLQLETDKYAEVVAGASNGSLDHDLVLDMMRRKVTLSSKDAMRFGLVHGVYRD